MDPVDTCGDDPPGVNKRTRDCHKRPRLRKTATRPPPSMQRADKRGPTAKEKKTAAAAAGGEWGRSPAWPSLQKEARRGRHGGGADGEEEGGADALRFACARCRGDARYAPKDLARHFEEEHGGSAPVFACGACSFSTHEFSHLQLHLLSHKETFSGCAACRDGVARTWPELSAHLAARHRRAGEYSCAACPKFSTGDVGLFLEHTYAHHAGGGEGVEGLPAPAKGEGRGPKTSARAPRCRHCGFEAPQEWLIAKHVKAVHVLQNGNQRKKKKKEEEEEEVDQIPKVKPRLTRSAVREACWLSRDCRSLPGRDFLDQYCQLSDPRTTLEETQQLLRESVSGDRKWTKALKTVLSNVPQDGNADPKSESVTAASSPDLKNEIAAAQNGKRLKAAATPSEKETPDGAPEDEPRVVVQNGRGSNPSERTARSPNKSKPNEEEEEEEEEEEPPPPECPRMQENGESREPMGEQEMEEGGKPPEGPTPPDGTGVSGEPKWSNRSGERTGARKVTPKRKRRRRKRAARSKRSGGRSSGPKTETETRRLSPSSPSPPGGAPAGGDLPAAPCPRTAVLAESSGAGAPGPRRTPGEVAPGAAEELPERSVAEIAESRSARRPTPAPGTDRRESSDGAAPRRGSAESSPVSISTVATRGDVSSEDVVLVPSADGGRRDGDGDGDGDEDGDGDGDPPAGRRPDLLGNLHRAPSPSPPAARPRRPLPKHRARTLKLVAVRRSQPVKRPAGDQPVVVLNHPDACIPEAARIMEVIRRYRGEAQKVALSRRTAAALAAAEESGPADSAACAVSAVQERFLLKLKLRRLSRKKYEVVDASSPGGGVGEEDEDEEDEEEEEAAAAFRCWFCGRLLACREAWTAHRRRHLTEWRKPNCENS